METQEQRECSLLLQTAVGSDSTVRTGADSSPLRHRKQPWFKRTTEPKKDPAPEFCQMVEELLILSLGQRSW